MFGPKRTARDVVIELVEGLRNGTLDLETPPDRLPPSGEMVLFIVFNVGEIILGVTIWVWLLIGSPGQDLFDLISRNPQTIFQGPLYTWILYGLLMLFFLGMATYFIKQGLGKLLPLIRSDKK